MSYKDTCLSNIIVALIGEIVVNFPTQTHYISKRAVRVILNKTIKTPLEWEVEGSSPALRIDLIWPFGKTRAIYRMGYRCL